MPSLSPASRSIGVVLRRIAPGLARPVRPIGIAAVAAVPELFARLTHRSRIVRRGSFRIGGRGGSGWRVRKWLRGGLSSRSLGLGSLQRAALDFARFAPLSLTLALEVRLIAFQLRRVPVGKRDPLVPQLACEGYSQFRNPAVAIVPGLDQR